MPATVSSPPTGAVRHRAPQRHHPFRFVAAILAIAAMPAAFALPAKADDGIALPGNDLRSLPITSIAPALGTFHIATMAPEILALPPAPLVAVPSPVAELRPVRPIRQMKPVAEPKSVVEPATPAPRSPRLLRSCGYRPGAQELPALDARQRRNARTIVELATLLGLPPRAAVIALATAYQESWLRNLNWGDRDSLGLFQQRPSYGWGKPRNIRTPNYAAAAFYLPLTQMPGWERMPLTKAAQAVQRSAFPNRYARWELMAAKLVDRYLDDVPDRALNCRH